jgi:effector-binding domain-containing protein
VDDLLPIGRFAKATRLSVKALRHAERLHRDRLEARLAEHRRMLAYLQRLLDKEDIMPYEVTVKELPAQPVAATRTTTDLRGVATAISDGVHAVLGELGRRGIEPAGGPAAVTVHRGPYAEIGPAYHTVSGWVADHGHELAGGPREVYLNDPSQVAEADLLAEVQWPIR